MDYLNTLTLIKITEDNEMLAGLLSKITKEAHIIHNKWLKGEISEKEWKIVEKIAFKAHTKWQNHPMIFCNIIN